MSPLEDSHSNMKRKPLLGQISSLNTNTLNFRFHYTHNSLHLPLPLSVHIGSVQKSLESLYGDNIPIYPTEEFASRMSVSMHLHYKCAKISYYATFLTQGANEKQIVDSGLEYTMEKSAEVNDCWK